MVKRYWWVEDGMEEFERGDFVFYPDYAALAERCERLEAALRDILRANDDVDHPQWQGSPVRDAVVWALASSSKEDPP